MKDEQIYQLALASVPNIGPVQIKKLLETFGSASAIFTASPKDLGEVGNVRVNELLEFKDFDKAEKELAFMNANDIELIFYTDARYPSRLKECPDPPAFLFAKGNMQLNAAKIVAIVGTRINSHYGKTVTEELVNHLNGLQDVLVVSGLAFGIDAIAHQACLDIGIPTVGVLGHGMKTLYPYQHKYMAEKMVEQNGGILSELFHDAMPDRYNFPKRNRVVAGMADATIVIETATKGGSIITANLANDYNRDVFAVPGKLTDIKSEGCNWLIANKKAELYTSPQDFVRFMAWDTVKKPKVGRQRQLFVELDENELKLVKILEPHECLSIDELAATTDMPQGKIASLLLNLELQGIVESLPGKRYKLV